jgi:predicted helicase
VKILDPACGTGTFLVEVIDVIHRTMKAKWRKERHMELEIPKLWNEYVAEHLLPRLYGFELMMAPYAIAHMKLGLKLHETGYNFRSHERARIYLTNTLEEPKDFSDRFEFDAPALAHEAHAVNAVKRATRFTAVVGNPPYSNFGQMNRNEWILSLLRDYKKGLDERKLNLDDDFIKFIRFAQFEIDGSRQGILAFISNNTYVDGITHRRMRQSLMESFHKIRILDLHGSAKRRDRCPDGSADENVFDIQQGVAIGIFSAPCAAKSAPYVGLADAWGLREWKYRRLYEKDVIRTAWTEIRPESPHFFFVNRVRGAGSGASIGTEYTSSPSVTDIFPCYSSGFQTKRDGIAVAETRARMRAIIRDFASMRAKDIIAKYQLPPDGRDWRIEWAVAHAKKLSGTNGCLVECLYRPFDTRWTVLDDISKGFVAYPRFEVMRHITAENIGIILTRQLSLRTFQHAWVTRHPIDGNTISLQTREYNYLFPLYLYPDEKKGYAPQLGSRAGQDHRTGRRANFAAGFSDRVERILQASFTPNGNAEGQDVFGPEDVFHCIYAVLHSPTYRRRYFEQLSVDFPRVPLVANKSLFWSLCVKGADLAALHLLEDHYRYASWNSKAMSGRSPLRNPIVAIGGRSDAQVATGYPRWVDGKVYISPSRWFEEVPDKVWNFYVGGFRVCEKWLKDRRGRTLSDQDILHYQRIVVALNETIRLMAEIDKVIEAHGGWPGAFATSAGKAQK